MGDGAVHSSIDVVVRRPVGFALGNAANRLGTGKNGPRPLNEKKYVRLMHRPHRGKYEHRVVMATAAAEFCFYPLDLKSGLPSGFSVEHVDHNRTHNCLSNLLLLSVEIHNWCSRATRSYRDYRVSEMTGEDWKRAVYGQATKEELDAEFGQVPF